MSSNKARGSLHHKTQERCLHAELHRGGLWPTGMHCPFSKSQLRTTRASVVGTPRSADYPNNFVCYRAWAICQASPVGKLCQAACGCVEPHPCTHHYLEQTQKGLLNLHIQFLTLEMGVEESSILSHVAHEVRTLSACKAHAEFARKDSKTACRQTQGISTDWDPGSLVSSILKPLQSLLSSNQREVDRY